MACRIDNLASTAGPEAIRHSFLCRSLPAKQKQRQRLMQPKEAPRTHQCKYRRIGCLQFQVILVDASQEHAGAQPSLLLLRGRQRKSSGAQLATKSGDKSSKWKQQSAQLRLAMKASQGDSLAVAALTAQAHNVRPNPGKQDTTVPCIMKCAFAAHMLMWPGLA